MSQIYYLILAAALSVSVVLAAVLVLRLRRFAGQQVRQVRRIGMDAVWNIWMDGDCIDSATRTRCQALLDNLDQAALTAVHDGLIEFESGVSGTQTSLATVRQEIMACVDRRMLNREILDLPPEMKTRIRAQSDDMLQSDEEAVRYIAANEIRMAVLREYAAQRWGDCADDDWFAVYQRASGLKQRSARNFIQRSLTGEQGPTEDARYQTIAMVDTQLRSRLLQIPPGTSFKGLKDREQIGPGKRQPTLAGPDD